MTPATDRTLYAPRAWRLLLAAMAAARAGDLPGRFGLGFAPGGGGARLCDAGGPGALVTAAADGWQPHTEVEAGAAQLFDLHLPLVFAAAKGALTLAQLGQSLDGRIATEGGHSHYVTGDANRDHLHRLRALVDAVVVGAGTVAADDPRLTVRRVDGDNPTRVVLDPRRRLPAELQVFADGAAPTLLLCAEAAGSAGERHGEAEVVPVTADADGLAPAAVLDVLHARGLSRVLVEGGGVTVSRFLAAGVLDRLHVGVAPLLIGSGRPALALPPIATLDDALRPPTHVYRMGDDTLFDCDLRAGR